MKLVDNARHAWQWFSVQAFVLAGALQAVWMQLPPDMKTKIPDNLVSVATIAICVLGVIGRLTSQPKANPK